MGLTKAYARIEELEKENAQLRLQIDMLKLEKENDGWHHCSERMPECEQEVLITYARKYYNSDKVHYGVTSAFYEDGEMYVGDSIWNWYEHDFKYDEKEEDYIVDEGWWEYKHFLRDDDYNNPVDCEVIAWMPLPKEYMKEV